ncbi:hypothetical protein Syun_017834 [Stephania yunnanensis]|uniref:non-specific serine/threonine protein kinase n=1 Tax=Stephania yunnanensis TaxID=152371 RepID=A0AAP0P2T1_9MAGN
MSSLLPLKGGNGCDGVGSGGYQWRRDRRRLRGGGGWEGGPASTVPVSTGGRSIVLEEGDGKDVVGTKVQARESKQQCRSVQDNLALQAHSSFQNVNDNHPGGEGMAFILTADPNVPENSSGQWLGMVNSTTNGSSQAQIISVEFDTRESFPENIDNNHVGVNVNSIKSMRQFPMSSRDVNLSNEMGVTVNIQYSGKSQSITVLLSGTNRRQSSATDPVISVSLNLAEQLSQDVYVGFSALTGDLSEIDLVVSLSMSLTYFCCKHRKGAEAERIKRMIKQSNKSPHEFRLKEQKSATRNFHPDNKFGEGGFGKVYKGSIAEMDVAIKRLSKDSHEGKQELFSIICGVASALEYLHVGCNMKVLHRDVKARNVMLDSKFNAVLGDFGLARNIQDAGKTHHSTKDVAGTPGYMAPEYVLTRKPVHKTRDHENRGNYIVDWLWELYGKGMILNAVDSRMHMDLNEEQMERTQKLGLACCHPDPNQRPLTSKVLQILSVKWLHLFSRQRKFKY